MSVTLKSSSCALNALNNIISNINENILERNNKIDRKESEFKKLKTAFWDLMRWEYDNTISSLNTETKASQKKIDSLNNKIQDYEDEISEQNVVIVQQQKKTVNI